ncbi:MAG: hypothetical protein NVS4B11_22070 [Ktedonobacteraceae bacterium]
MQDSEEQYPPPRKGNQPSSSDDPVEPDEPNQVPARASRMQSGQSFKQPKLSRTPRSLLPERGLWYALIAGGIAGILDVLINVAITISNAATYQRVVSEGKNITLTTASSAFGLLLLSLFIDLLIFGITGYIVGRIAVRRRLGFLAGAMIGAIAYLISFLVRYIPNYPGNTATSGATNAATIGTALLFLLISAIISGLISLFGTWLATRKHPYYTT